MTAALFPDLIVNGEHVPHQLIAAETQNQDAPAGKPGIAWRKAVKAVTIRTLLLQEATARDLKSDPQEVEPGRFETQEEALIRGLLDTQITTTRPTDEAVLAEWKKDPTRFRTQPLWEVSHILCGCDPRDEQASKKAKARADALVARIVKDPKTFVALASSDSDCGSKSSGGALGQIGPNDTVPEFEAALHEMDPGEVTAVPVLTRHGWHIIRMDEIAPGNVLPFNAVRQKISEAMEKADWARQARLFVSKLVDTADISGADMRPI